MEANKWLCKQRSCWKACCLPAVLCRALLGLLWSVASAAGPGWLGEAQLHRSHLSDSRMAENCRKSPFNCSVCKPKETRNKKALSRRYCKSIVLYLLDGEMELIAMCDCPDVCRLKTDKWIVRDRCFFLSDVLQPGINYQLVSRMWKFRFCHLIWWDFLAWSLSSASPELMGREKRWFTDNTRMEGYDTCQILCNAICNTANDLVCSHT